ncbi:MAG: hypothetical protein PHE27_07705 [Alphaproteobacteria bacterium]|nr:hypothetical protein [Alphaproteobacteria bacterium]
MKKYTAIALVAATVIAAAPFASAHAGERAPRPMIGPKMVQRHAPVHHVQKLQHRRHAAVRHGNNGLLLGLVAGVTGAALWTHAVAPPPPARVVYAPRPVVQKTVIYQTPVYTTTYYGY